MNKEYSETKEVLEDVSEKIQSIVYGAEDDIDNIISWKPSVLDDLILALVKASSLMAVADRIDKMIKEGE